MKRNCKDSVSARAGGESWGEEEDREARQDRKRLRMAVAS